MNNGEAGEREGEGRGGWGHRGTGRGSEQINSYLVKVGAIWADLAAGIK